MLNQRMKGRRLVPALQLTSSPPEDKSLIPQVLTSDGPSNRTTGGEDDAIVIFGKGVLTKSVKAKPRNLYHYLFKGDQKLMQAVAPAGAVASLVKHSATSERHIDTEEIENSENDEDNEAARLVKVQLQKYAQEQDRLKRKRDELLRTQTKNANRKVTMRSTQVDPEPTTLGNHEATPVTLTARVEDDNFRSPKGSPVALGRQIRGSDSENNTQEIEKDEEDIEVRNPCHESITAHSPSHVPLISIERSGGREDREMDGIEKDNHAMPLNNSEVALPAGPPSICKEDTEGESVGHGALRVQADAEEPREVPEGLGRDELQSTDHVERDSADVRQTHDGEQGTLLPTEAAQGHAPSSSAASPSSIARSPVPTPDPDSHPVEDAVALLTTVDAGDDMTNGDSPHDQHSVDVKTPSVDALPQTVVTEVIERADHCLDDDRPVMDDDEHSCGTLPQKRKAMDDETDKEGKATLQEDQSSAVVSNGAPSNRPPGRILDDPDDDVEEGHLARVKRKKLFDVTGLDLQTIYTSDTAIEGGICVDVASPGCGDDGTASTPMSCSICLDHHGIIDIDEDHRFQHSDKVIADESASITSTSIAHTTLMPLADEGTGANTPDNAAAQATAEEIQGDKMQDGDEGVITRDGSAQTSITDEPLTPHPVTGDVRCVEIEVTVEETCGGVGSSTSRSGDELSSLPVLTEEIAFSTNMEVWELSEGLGTNPEVTSTTIGEEVVSLEDGGTTYDRSNLVDSKQVEEMPANYLLGQSSSLSLKTALDDLVDADMAREEASKGVATIMEIGLEDWKEVEVGSDVVQQIQVDIGDTKDTSDVTVRVGSIEETGSLRAVDQDASSEDAWALTCMTEGTSTNEIKSSQEGNDVIDVGLAPQDHCGPAVTQAQDTLGPILFPSPYAIVEDGAESDGEDQTEDNHPCQEINNTCVSSVQHQVYTERSETWLVEWLPPATAPPCDEHVEDYVPLPTFPSQFTSIYSPVTLPGSHSSTGTCMPPSVPPSVIHTAHGPVDALPAQLGAVALVLGDKEVALPQDESEESGSEAMENRITEDTVSLEVKTDDAMKEEDPELSEELL